MEWDIFKGMKIGGGFGYTKQTDRGDRFQPRSHSGFLQVSDEDSKGSYDWKYGEMSSYQFEATASYGNTFGRHRIYAGANWNMQ